MNKYSKPLAPARIAAAKDEDIDFSDIPELEKTRQEAEFAEPDLTQQITMRVKRSVLDYFKAPGKGLPNADQPRDRELCANATGVAMRHSGDNSGCGGRI